MQDRYKSNQLKIVIFIPHILVVVIYSNGDYSWYQNLTIRVSCASEQRYIEGIFVSEGVVKEHVNVYFQCYNL